jgi:hypothetical protein
VKEPRDPPSFFVLKMEKLSGEAPQIRRSVLDAGFEVPDDLHEELLLRGFESG